jgi:hypothetical protein
VDVEGIEGVSVRSLATGEAGDLWVGTDDGVVILSDGGSVRALVRHEDGLPGDQVLSMTAGSDGWMWVGTSGGVALLAMDGRVHATFTTDDGLVHSRVQAIAEHPEGSMWLGTAGGLSKLEKRQWHLMLQTMDVREDLPDVYIADIIMDPDVPTVGQEVTFHVSVFNPSTLAAITAVDLALDDDGSPGESISDGRAYTQPGSAYAVDLNWTAQGGQRTLWVIVDREDRVPETDEGNNVVALSFNVNRPPALGEPSYGIVNITNHGWTEAAEGNFTVEVSYSDGDGDPPRTMRVDDTGGWTLGNLTPVAGEGDIVTGRTYRTTLHLFEGVQQLVLVFGDGVVEVNRTLTIPFRLEILLTDPQPSYEIEDEISLPYAIKQPYHGSSIVDTESYLMPTDWSLEDDDWSERRLGPHPTFTQDEINLWRSPATEDVEGTFNLLVWCEDDQGYDGYLLIENVTLVGEDEPEGSPLWLAAVGLVAVVVIAAAIVMSRRGDDR